MKRQAEAAESILALLSIDLLIKILDHVEESADRKNFRLVCRQFLRAEAFHRRGLRILRREFIPHMLTRYGSNLEALDLSVCTCFGDQALVGVSLAARNLRRIDLSRASGVGWRGLEALARRCGRLEAVDLSHCVGVGDREMAAVVVAAVEGGGCLRELRADKCLGVTDVGLANVAVRCGGRLEKLGIKWCLEVSDIGVELLAKKCKGLKVLDLSYLKVTNKSLKSISSLEKLEVLSLVGCSQIDDEGLGYLNNGCNSLKSIDVSRCENVTSAGLISVIEGHRCIEELNLGDCFPELAPLFLSKLSILAMTLKSLKLDGFHVSASSLQTIGLNCKNLKEISLSKCLGVTDEGISALVSKCNGLIMIDLTCCRLLTDKSLSAISNHCKNLECLWLESCSSITKKGLDQIATFCTNLKKIDLTDCKIDDEALKYISRCFHLTVLKLGLCTGITNEGLSYIGLNCKNLLELDLYCCCRVSDDGLAYIAVGCKKLKKLNLCYCTEITDQGMKYLSSLKELSDLELRGLNITSLGITAVAIGCSSLAELDLKRCYSVDDVAMFSLAQNSPNLRQINISYCSVSGVGLVKLLSSLGCLQDVDLVHLARVSLEAYKLGLTATCGRLKKLKLVKELRNLLAPGLLQMLHARGCRMRWVDKPL